MGDETYTEASVEAAVAKLLKKLPGFSVSSAIKNTGKGVALHLKQSETGLGKIFYFGETRVSEGLRIRTLSHPPLKKASAAINAWLKQKGP